MLAYEIKEGVDPKEVQMLTAPAFYLLGALTLYCHQHKLPPPVITSLRDHYDGRVSTGHKDSRAFDVSTRGWTVDEIDDMVHEFNARYKNIAAFSASDLVPRAVIYHKVDGNAWHLHFQVRPGHLIKENIFNVKE